MPLSELEQARASIKMLEAKLRARGCRECGGKVGHGLLDLCETHRLDQTLALLEALAHEG